MIGKFANVGEYLAEVNNDPSFRSHQGIRDKVNNGDFGVKTGKGFYQYQNSGSDEFWEKINGSIVKTLKAIS